jgi:hypothetical protein
MAVELFDPSQIDSAVGDAFGTKVKPRPAPAPAPTATPNVPAPIRTNNPGALMPGGKLAEYGSMEEGLAALDKNLASYGKKGINTLSGVISTWAPPKENDTNAYIAHVAKVTGLDPNQQIDLSNPLVRHQISAGITQMESGRKAIYGQGGSAPASSASTTGFPSIGEQDINSAVTDAFKNPEPAKPQGATGKVASKVGEFFRGQGRAAASLADVTLGSVIPSVAGAVTYAGARAIGQTPEQAAATQQKVTSAVDKPFGKAFGVTETPEYKGEASQQLMNFIGANMEKGADWISQQTGVPKTDVENMMNTALIEAPAGVKAAGKTKLGQVIKGEAEMAGQAVKQGVQAVTPEVVQRGVGRAVEAVAPGTTTVKPPIPTPTVGGQPPQAAPYAQPGGGRASVGAAATPDATIIKQALETATPEFKQLYGNMPLDKVNAPVVLRHLEGDSLPVPVRLTEGQATGDLVKISKEQNIRGTPEGQALAYRLNEQNKALVENVPAIRERAAPDVYSTRTIESSEALIDAYKKLDAERSAQITNAYKKLEDANGGTFPVDGVQLAKNADALLSKKLKTNFVPPEIAADLKRFREGEPMTFEQFEALRTNLAAEIRKAERSGDGNRSMASSLVYQALEDLPLQGSAAQLKPLADTARSLAKSRFDALKKDPAYKAAVNETVPADKFFDKYVIRGVNKNVRTMVDTLGRDSVGHQHIKAGTINWLSDKAGIVDGKGNFSQANYNKALKSLDDVRNYGEIFDPETQLQLKTLGNVANYTQFQPRGSYVNNSNTLVGYLANKAAGGAEALGNVAGLKFVGGYPIGSEARKFIRSRKEKAAVEKSLEPGAGSTLEEVKNKGK